MSLTILPIAHDCPSACQCSKPKESIELRKEFGEGATFDIDETQGLDDVAHRVEHGEPLRPHGHGADGGEKAWHEDENDEEEEHGERSLAGTVAIVAYDKGKWRNQNAEHQ